jgi:hypothetical protein
MLKLTIQQFKYITYIYPLHLNQHAYQIGKSTETALHNVVTCIEYAIEHKAIALGAFLDIVGASDKTYFDIKTGC